MPNFRRIAKTAGASVATVCRAVVLAAVNQAGCVPGIGPRPLSPRSRSRQTQPSHP